MRNFRILFLIAFYSCSANQHNIDNDKDVKHPIIDIYETTTTITEDSIRVDIQLKENIDSFRIAYYRIQILFDVDNNDSIKGDIALGFIKMGNASEYENFNGVLKSGSLNAAHLFSEPNGSAIFFVIKNLKFENNCLKIRIDKTKHELFRLITASTKWYVYAIMSDSSNSIHDHNKYYEDYYSPFFDEKIKTKEFFLLN